VGTENGRTPHLVVVAPPAIHTTRWCDYFRGIGWRVDWISYGFADDGAVDHIPQLNTGRIPIWPLLRERRRLRAMLDRLEPDLVHAHWFVGPGWLMALLRNRPFTVTAWGSDALLFAALSRYRVLMGRLVGKRAAAVTYDSESIADALAAVGVPRELMHRIVFGPDSSLFRPRGRNTELLRRLGVTNDDPNVLSLRGLDEVYEPETVLRAFAEVARERPCNLLLRVDSVHIGDEAVVSNTEALWGRLRGVAADLGILDRVVPYENVAREELPELLSSSDVFVSVPSSDGTSVALLEALFCEVPVVVSELPANREWIPDEGYGKVVPIGDPAALARAIGETLDDLPGARERARLAGEHARPLAEGSLEYGRARDLSLEVLAAARG
jgi:glycosyltransferase involved in cell wall biosynthesis